MNPLTSDELFLLECAAAGERGLATYAEKKLTGHVLLSRTSDGILSTFMWDEEKHLWRERNEEATMKSFFDRDLAPALERLQERVESVATKADPQTKELKILHKALNKANTKVGMKAIFSMATSDIASEDKLNKYSDYLPLADGKKICLRDGKVSERTKEDYWSFNVLATSEPPSEQAKADALRFHQNMCIRPDDTIDHAKVEYLQTLCGYSLTFETTDKALYFLVGISDCGKSLLFEEMIRILKDRVNSCQPDIFIEVARGSTHQTYLVPLLGKSMVFCQELPKGRNVNSDVVKRLTGNDQVTFRRCGAKGPPESFVNSAKLFVGSQNMPVMDGGDSGMVTRIRKIPFARDLIHLPADERKANLELLERLKTQDGINGLFYFWLEGAKRYYAGVLNGITRIAPPECVKEENADFLGESDSFERFIADCCDEWKPEMKVARESFTYPRRELQNHYHAYALRMNYDKAVILDKTGVSSRMRLRFPGQKGQGAWIGVRKKVEEQAVAQIQL